MTDWRERLQTFNRLSPDQDLYQRARRGPRREAPPEGPSRTSRIVAAVTAAAVAVAAGVFAWTAFHPEPPMEEPTPPSIQVADLGEDGSVLWPEISAEGLAERQAALDAGRGGDRWLLDPDALTHRFAETVLGWYDDGTYDVSTEPTADGLLRTTLTRVPEECDPPDEDRGVMECLVGTEELLLAQPVRSGEGGLWAIVEVRAPTLTVDVAAGETVTNGGSVSVNATLDDRVRVVVGSAVGAWSDERPCGTYSGTARLTTQQDRIAVAVPPDRASGTECGEAAPGYVWVATATWHASAGADPLNGDSTYYVEVTAVPIVVAIPENTTGPGLTTYRDTLGWSVDYPSGWIVTPIEVHRLASYLGASFTNVGSEGEPSSPPASDQDPSTPGSMSANAIWVGITHVDGPPPDLLTDDTSFPVTLAGLGCEIEAARSCETTVRANGLDYTIAVMRGSEVLGEDLAAAEALVASLRFPVPRADEKVGGWISLGEIRHYPEGRGTATWANARLGVVYVLRGPNGTYALDLAPDGCGEGQNTTWDRATLQIWLQCPDYTGNDDARFDRFGNPDPQNDANFSAPLHAFPVIEAWDGSLLVHVSGAMDDLPEMYWP